jgi:hypothetical protein
MNKVYYLEPDEEITKVIDRIRKSEEAGVVLVVPRGSSISQSTINLKLLKRNASDHGKVIGIVSSDKITNNLADQVGIEVFSKVTEAEKASLNVPVKAEEATSSSLKVNRYKKYDLSKMTEDSELEPEPEDDPDLEEPEEQIEESVPEEEVVVEEIPEEEHEEQSEPEIQAKALDVKKDNEEEEMVVMSPNKKEKRHIKTEGSRKAFLVISSIVLVGLAAAFYVLIPTTEASLILKTSDVEKKSNIFVDKNQAIADPAVFAVPGQLVEVEKSITKEFDSTGKKDIGEKAHGTITISNTVSTKAITVSPGAKVTAADGKIFYIEKGVLVPGKTAQTDISKCHQDAQLNIICDPIPGVVDASVIASENGDKYNIPATTFTVGQLTASSKTTFTGGVTKNVSFVTDEDLAKAEVTIKEEGTTQGKQGLIDKAAEESLKIFEKNIAVEIISQDSNKKINDEADKFQITARVKLMALGFKEDDLRKIMSDLTGQDLTADKMLINADKTELTYEMIEDSMSEGKIKISADFKGKVGPKISSDNIKEGVKNRSYTDAVSYLGKIEGVESVSLKITPKLLNRTSFLTKKIKVDFDYQK